MHDNRICSYIAADRIACIGSFRFIALHLAGDFFDFFHNGNVLFGYLALLFLVFVVIDVPLDCSQVSCEFLAVHPTQLLKLSGVFSQVVAGSCKDVSGVGGIIKSVSESSDKLGGLGFVGVGVAVSAIVGAVFALRIITAVFATAVSRVGCWKVTIVVWRSGHRDMNFARCIGICIITVFVLFVFFLCCGYQGCSHDR